MRDGGFPIVAIGASAGGLEALRELFAHLPNGTGMAFVVIQHLDPDHPSMLANILASDHRMPVVEVTDGMPAEPNRVHVIPPGADLTIQGGILRLVPRQQAPKIHLPIDTFFCALAEDQKGRAIGVVLSGSGSDGSEGLRAIKAEGGITFAQDSESAQFRSMPESAAAAGVVDHRMSPAGIAQELTGLSRHPYLAHAGADEPRPDSTNLNEEEALRAIFGALGRHTQLDFSGYKRPTVMRRIARRMALRLGNSMTEYARTLQDDAREAKALAEDLLIHVTSFFRDPAAFESLKRHLPELLKDGKHDAAIRVWVPGCSTGEEAYTLIICLFEFLEGEGRSAPRVPIKLFGSDLSEAAIATARAGYYAESELDSVSAERLARYFERTEGGYRVGKEVRDTCVFVKHDLTRDPPFAKLSLISCRNVLIYFDAELQGRIFPMLHHCLNTGGLLFLGSSEAVTGFADCFSPLDKEHRIFVKTGESPRLTYPLSFGHEAEAKLRSHQSADRRQPEREAQKQADHFLLSRYAPPGVVVNERWEVVQFRGRTGAFLELPPGQPQVNVLRMAREGLVGHLHEALETAKRTSVAVRKPGVRITEAEGVREVDLEVVSLTSIGETNERYFLVVFDEVVPQRPAGLGLTPPQPERENGGPIPTGDDEVSRLRAELVATRDYLQEIIGDHQGATEELAATNEELIAANEELQSTNEELESAKEELQSTNEELTTVNDELRERNRQMDRVANDLTNVLESVQIPVIIVDLGLRIRRFTPTARDISSLLPGDVGRPIDDVRLKVEVANLADRIREVIEASALREWEVQGSEGRWFRLQIRPYRTADKRLDGAVLSFIDVDALKGAVQEAEGARDYARAIVETVPIPLVVLDEDLRIVSANPAFHEGFALSPLATEGVRLFDLAEGAWEVPALRASVQRSLAGHARFRDVEIRRQFPEVGRKDLVLAGCPIPSGSGGSKILLVIEDVTERRLLESSEKQARVEAERANRAKDLFLATLSHELRTPLSAILISAQVLKRKAAEDPQLQRATAAIERAVGNQAKLIDDLLDISRIVSGKLMLDLQAVDLTVVVHSAVDVARGAAEAKGLELEFSVHGSIGPIHGDSGRLQQVVANLLNNSIKFTPRGGKIVVDLAASGGQAEITITDTGVGMNPEILPDLFERFIQAEGSMTRAHGGLGLGLAIVRHLVNVHGGEVRAESRGEGKGSTFRILLPVAVTAVRAEAPRSVARSVGGVRVLLIDDDDDTRESFASMLDDLGADVRAASSAAKGLAAVETFNPQVILCDIAMPREDGYTFIRALRSLGKDKGGQTPVAALTALAGEEDRRRALSAGFQMHLAKPIDSARLAAAVGTLSVWAEHGTSPSA
jgi:two-component system CheB/CheR fusion protein